MAQDPEDLDEQPEGTVDTSHDLDWVTLYDSLAMDFGEMEADNIHGVLESNGISSIVERTPLPPLGFHVKVPRSCLEEARRLIQEALAAGPEAADEAEAASEEGR